MPSKPVGIIANPMSGKDIRRIVASGLVVGNHEKANIVRRVLQALDALWQPHAFLMPDGGGLAKRIVEDIELGTTSVALFDLPYVLGSWKDTLRTAEMMAERDFGCIVTLGGDGTNRIVAKACGDVPLIPISTGTNNVFPEMVEGTVAGLAAGHIASGAVAPEAVCRRAPVLELLRNGIVVDTALIDLVVLDSHDVGARAVWEPGSIKELFLADIRPDAIGLSSIGARLNVAVERGSEALHVRTGKPGRTILTPLLPGSIARLNIAGSAVFPLGKRVPIASRSGIVALDGERELVLDSGASWQVRLSARGPRVVDVSATMQAADSLHTDQENTVVSLRPTKPAAARRPAVR